MQREYAERRPANLFHPKSIGADEKVGKPIPSFLALPTPSSTPQGNTTNKKGPTENMWKQGMPSSKNTHSGGGECKSVTGQGKQPQTQAPPGSRDRCRNVDPDVHGWGWGGVPMEEGELTNVRMWGNFPQPGNKKRTRNFRIPIQTKERQESPGMEIMVGWNSPGFSS